MLGMDRRALLRAGSFLTAAGLVGSALAQPAPLSPVVTTTYGRVQGLTHGDVHAFKGLRYGAAPTGAMRFKPPQPPRRFGAHEIAT